MKRKKSLLERIFPRTSFWWNASWNGVFGEGRYNYTFRYDKLALVISLITSGLILIYILFDIIIK
jgi:hypothetical protein